MSLLATRLQNLRADASLDQWNLRPSRYGLTDYFFTSTESPNSILAGGDLRERAESSIGNTVQVPVFQYDASVTIGSSRSVTISGGANTSALYNVSWVTYAWGFTHTPAAYMNNEISSQKDWERKFLKYLYAFAATVEAGCGTALSTAKSQVITDPLVYSVSADTIHATLSQEDRIVGDVNPILFADDFPGQIHLIGNAGFQSLINRLAEQSVYNDRNKTIQYQDKIIHYTNAIANAANKTATFYAALDGAVGLLWRHERESLLRTRSRTGHEWDIITLPMLGLPVSTYYYEGVADENTLWGVATADMTRAWTQYYGFSVDLAYITPYNQDPATYANPIYLFDIADA